LDGGGTESHRIRYTDTYLLYEECVLEYFACLHDADDRSLDVQLAIFIHRGMGLLHLLTTVV